jgi:predicted house-cleaning noncanonical NTP pyrophosphatase (MazG superfamily)
MKIICVILVALKAIGVSKENIQAACKQKKEQPGYLSHNKQLKD